MPSIFSKLKRIVLSLLILSLILGLLSQSSKVQKSLSPSLYGRVVLVVLSPFQKLITYSQNKFVNLANEYVFLVNTQRENTILATQIRQMQRKMLFFQFVQIENQRLRSLVNFQEALEWNSIVAQVVSYSPLAEFQMLTINKGEKEGIQRRMPVVSQLGLVGQIYRTTAHTSQVLLITDPTSVVAGVIFPSQERALVVGKIDNVALDRPFYLTRLEYLHHDSNVNEGNEVITSGMDGVFPRGIPIGLLQNISKDKFGIYDSASLVPHVSLTQLTEVVVISNKKED
ncbi:MAG: rod shape-determining protein MreC [Deltaproteobacteria bacterium RIFCSPLOWO2_02_FULL_50_16]|nr:MAG: rod shape-determining protein MreC [Deltaproteobacteria bacterium GWA2_50_8]OGQ25710.1 MAG: rod shape-determining protein MreC [Deltaproteobacteria bacterium RIFCSPHIGHO2_02_FULL_50_15]OGQ56973.1 MAG: rod shape-determining protein MreC [Deltaproteobacteria bacterium RIFCSPLOWO2_02_FULL_50_16]OGQ68051.1 MAG: rod shape-determining protein MreC [Deltaproteobacteria bacterium RIFCSPLOWO2_12_FULL_50_11]